jgi:hypothetical protein
MKPAVTKRQSLRPLLVPMVRHEHRANVQGLSSHFPFNLIMSLRSRVSIVSAMLAMGLSLPAHAAVVSALQPSQLLVAQQPRSLILSLLQLPFRSYLAPDGSFSVKIPGMCPVERPGARCGNPAPVVNIERGVNAGRRFQQFTISGGSYEVAFGLLATEVEGNPKTKQYREGWMANQVQSLRNRLEGKGATLVRAQQLTVHGQQAVDLVWQGERHSSGTSTTFTRLVVAGNRLYELTVGTTDRLAAIVEPDARRYFNSFQILKVKA